LDSWRGAWLKSCVDGVANSWIIYFDPKVLTGQVAVRSDELGIEIQDLKNYGAKWQLHRTTFRAGVFIPSMGPGLGLPISRTNSRIRSANFILFESAHQRIKSSSNHEHLSQINVENANR